MRAESDAARRRGRQDLERRRIGPREHVALAGPGEALDRRAVEADALVERAVELGRGDRHRLQRAEDVGEPEPDEADLALLERAQYEFLLAVHNAPVWSGPVTERLRGPATPDAGLAGELGQCAALLPLRPRHSVQSPPCHSCSFGPPECDDLDDVADQRSAL